MCDKTHIDRESLVDIRTVQIDSSLPTIEKVRSFVEQVKNPYYFRVGEVAVRVAYSNTGGTMNDQFSNLLLML